MLHLSKIITAAYCLCSLMICVGRASAQEPDSMGKLVDQPKFFRGLNLNGEPLVIRGQSWEGKEAPWYECSDNAFESQEAQLDPHPEASLAKMIRSSRWGGNRVVLKDVPSGEYTLFLYVWEDNNSETYSVSLNGRPVLNNYSSGKAGHWERLGPWFVKPRQGKIEITSKGGAANFSGIEVWSGEVDGSLEEYDADQVAFFEKRIRPVLIEHCYECHSEGADELGGELLVDSRGMLRQGGANGPAVVPHNLKDSLLLTAMRYNDETLQMPPAGKLSDDVIADFETWISNGAADPRSNITKHDGKQIDVESARKFWSLRPIEKPVVPNVQTSQWVQDDIDAFVLQRMEQQGLSPAEPATKESLLRRVTYDLTGLPPTPLELKAFLEDESFNAYEKVVDRLLSSPRYGERWARHWMDVVRYADTAGDNSDFPIPQMRLYRDWIIDALNQDMPFDEFVRSQLAGDLMKSDSEELRRSRIVATGYIANARRFGSRVDDYPQHLTIEDTLDNFGRSLLGMTLSCARCHDHKFDPITTKDYYALYGVFNSTRYPWPGIELDQRQRDFVALVSADKLKEVEAELVQFEKKQKEAQKKVQSLKDQLKSVKDVEKSDLESKIMQAEKDAEELESTKPFVQTAYSVADAQVCEDVSVQLKGDPAKLGDVVPRRFFAVLGGQLLPEDYQGSGRDQLAEWILSTDNPLTARVIVNRIWQYHFGRGIVATPNDFGKQGQPPTHPELLDHLATWLRDNGWSLKALHKAILMTATYRQSTERSPIAIEKDPSNNYLSSFPQLRLDAESIRDTLLHIGGNLDLNRPAEHPFPPQHTWKFTQHNPFKAVYESKHRSVYLMTQRIQRHPYLAIFDGADPSTSTASRMVTTTPIQALFLLNNPLVHEQANLVAGRALAERDEDTERVRWLYRSMFSRDATQDEIDIGLKHIASVEKKYSAQPTEDSNAKLEAFKSYVRALFRLNEFIYLD